MHPVSINLPHNIDTAGHTVSIDILNQYSKTLLKMSTKKATPTATKATASKSKASSSSSTSKPKGAIRAHGAAAPRRHAAAAPGTKAAAAPAAAPAPAPVAKKEPTFFEISLKQINSVLADQAQELKDSGKWPYIVDEAGMSATFLRHRDTNFIETANATGLDKDKLRMALLGSIRFGKPLVLNMMDADMYDMCEKTMNDIQPGLWDSVFDKSILEEEKFMKIVKETDMEEYQKAHLYDHMKPNFQLVILCKTPNPILLDRMFPVKIV